MSGIPHLTFSSRMCGRTKPFLANSCQVDDSGNFYVAGYTDSDVDVYTHAGHYDVFVVKISASGSILWEHLYGGTSHDYGEALEAKRAKADVPWKVMEEIWQ